ncbi:MAG: RNA-binding transcriptional accessory protein [Oscillospiraceae bacterium]|nr:RNA-binding transcriptional accessory protein [Oscillospiraceae bacterium]
MDILKQIAEEMKLREEQVAHAVALLDDGKTVPFIARYRKEQTGSLDDQTLHALSDRLNYLRKLEERKQEITDAITALEKMTPELAAAISAAKTLVEVEDLYRPYKQKRKTKASVAKARGLEPLAMLLMEQNMKTNPEQEAAAFVDPEKEVPDAEAALAGACDIIAETVSDDADLRKRLRNVLGLRGSLTVKATDPDEDSVYRNYYDYAEQVEKIAKHRVLAVNRGEKEGYLKVSVVMPEGLGEQIVTKAYVKNQSPAGCLVETSALEAYKKSLLPAVQREVRASLTEDAAEQAITVFASNLRQLLLQPPMKGMITLGLDPGFRTGCKVAVVDPTGKVLATDVVYITANSKQAVEGGKIKLKRLIQQHHVEAIAIGNGTASRESEQVVSEILHELPECKAAYMVVSEAGASVYSASKLAAEEFPDYDVALRSAVSIARRLQDPLAELVKIEPKAIGVGEYQHDMPPARLNESLTGVVEDCVNAVGVDLNTASGSLLSYISGIHSGIAHNIVAYREENGAFTSRKSLLKVPKLGAKAYELCAGFLRVRDGKNPLDNTGVHPESYAAAEALLKECGYSLADIGGDLGRLSEAVTKQGCRDMAARLGIGEPTLRDIVKELQKPGRDPRDELPKPLMRSGDIMTVEDLKPGMELVGTVRNIIDFGAFVDIGVHEDGLVHVSQLANRFIKHPLDIVKVGQIVRVRVMEVDAKRKRISLTMKGVSQEGVEASS